MASDQTDITGASSGKSIHIEHVKILTINAGCTNREVFSESRDTTTTPLLAPTNPNNPNQVTINVANDPCDFTKKAGEIITNLDQYSWVNVYASQTSEPSIIDAGQQKLLLRGVANGFGSDGSTLYIECVRQDVKNIKAFKITAIPNKNGRRITFSYTGSDGTSYRKTVRFENVKVNEDGTENVNGTKYKIKITLENTVAE